MGLFRSSAYGDVVTTSVEECLPSASSMLYTTRDCDSLKYPLYMVQGDFDSIVATTWKHDEELGRGYLLLSTSGQDGKVWQWETGGGPIPIGRTLHLQNSGCRSNLYHNCSETTTNQQKGSGGIVVDALQGAPRLIVAEWGEGRIIRLEENGARTPLIIRLKDTSTSAVIDNKAVEGEEGSETVTELSTRRVRQPFQLLLTPFGDLMTLDTLQDGGSCLWHLPQATHIPGLKSLAASREAHAWDSINTTAPPQMLLRASHLGGMALIPNEWLQLYVTMQQENGPVVVVSLSLESEDDDDGGGDDDDDDYDDDDYDDQEEEIREKKPKVRQSKIVLDYSNYASQPGAIEVDDKGNLYLIVDDGVLFVSSAASVVAKVSVPGASFVDLTLGEDKFLYISTDVSLYRMRVRNGPVKIPTNLVLKPHQ